MAKTVTLIYPFKIKELDLRFDLKMSTILDPANMDDFLDIVRNVGHHYGPNGYFTDNELEQLKDIYKHLCIQLEQTDSSNKIERKKLKRQINHFKKNFINVEGDVRRWSFTDANYPLFKRLEKVDTDTYKVLYYST